MARNKKTGKIFYVSISTYLGKFDPDIQLKHLNEYINQRGFYLEWEYINGVSSRNLTLINYYRLTENRNTNIIQIWLYDRFLRSPKILINALKEFQIAGINLISNDENITTTQDKDIFPIRPVLRNFENSFLDEQEITNFTSGKPEESFISTHLLADKIKDQIMDLYKQLKHDNDSSNSTKFEYGTSWK